MRGKGEQMVRRHAGSPTLADRLATYPAFDALVPGFGRGLTEAHARQNLVRFRAARELRLEVLGSLLRVEAAIDVPAALASPLAQASPLTATLHSWADERWKSLADDRVARREVWLASRRTGAEIVYAMLLDVAILLGEIVCRAEPAWRWEVDLDPVDLADDMVTARRIVLWADPRDARGSADGADGVGGTVASVIDIEAIVVARYLQPSSPSLVYLNSWATAVDDAISGRARY